MLSQEIIECSQMKIFGIPFYEVKSKRVCWLETYENDSHRGVMHEKSLKIGDYCEILNSDKHEAGDKCNNIHQATTESLADIIDDLSDEVEYTNDQNFPVCNTKMAIQDTTKSTKMKNNPGQNDDKKELMESVDEETEESFALDEVIDENSEVKDYSKPDASNNLILRDFEKDIKQKSSKRKHGKANRSKSRNENCDREAYFEPCRVPECVISSFILFGISLKLKASGKMFILLLLILSGPSPASPAAMHQDPQTHRLQEYRLLLTTQCNYRDLILSETCHTNEESRKLYIEFCRFDKLCDKDSKPICLDGEDGGMLHICSPKNLHCPKGFRRKAWLENETDIVHVVEEKCPRGTYQPIESNCYDSCLNKHWNFEDLPEQFSLYSLGDNISPTWIYCNFEKGFYNMDGKFLLAYDDQFVHYPYFCNSISDHNPCLSGEYPLPNGTCVSSCEEGLSRDVHDGFKCTIKSWNGTDVVTLNETDRERAKQQKTTRKMTYTPTRSFETTNTTKTQTSEASDDKEVSTTALLTIITAVLVSVIMLIGLVIVSFKHKKDRRKPTHVTKVRKTENKTIIQKAENITVYNQISEIRSGRNDKATFEMQNFLPDEDN